MINVFLLPGETLIYLLSAHAPWAASLLGIGNDPIVLKIVLSALGWILTFVFAWALYRLALNSIRMVSTAYLVITHRIVHGTASLKTKLTCYLRRRFPRTESTGLTAESDVEFDKLDLAVLRVAATQDRSGSMSTLELANRCRVHPAQLEGSLRKLHGNKMIDRTVESAEGFGDYRLTSYGAAFISMYQRQQTVAA